MNSYYFKLNDKEIKVQLSYDNLGEISKKIRDELFTQKSYIVQTNAQPNVFFSFIQCLLDKTKIPEVTCENIYQYHCLCEEFGVLKDIIMIDQYDDILKLAIINNAQTQKNDIEITERYIAQNLDFYILNYPQNLYNLPINSLYNIFNDKQRTLINHDNAYHFITKCPNETLQMKLYVLLKSLDSCKLSKDILKESVSKAEDHFGFCPLHNDSFVETINQKIDDISSVLGQDIENLNTRNNQLQKENSEIRQNILNQQKQHENYQELTNQKFIQTEKDLLSNQKVQKEKFDEIENIIRLNLNAQNEKFGCLANCKDPCC